MSHPVPSAHLSPADAAFLYLERKEIPLAIASVSIFDGPIPFDRFVASIASRLDLVPRHRQIVVLPPLNLGLPTWEDDPHFDIRRHIFRVKLESPGGEAELELLAGKILSRMLDRSKPLWDIHVVDGLKGGRGALVWRLHHALADGISGSHLMEVMLDSTHESSHGIPRPRRRRPQPPRREHASRDGISSRVQSALQSLIGVEKGLVGFAGSLFSDPLHSDSKGLLALLPELAVSVERLPFNKPCGGERKFCWAELDLREVDAVRQAVGGKINDVVLTVLTRALARYVKLHGQTVANRFVRIVCPVSLRNGDQNSLGNRISFLPVALPMDVRNPVHMLRAVSARTATMKHAGAAYLLALAGGCIAAAPAPLQALFWCCLPELILPVPLFNMICTNITGPPVPLYAGGRRMLATYPQVPTGYDLGVNCAVESYDGKLFFGLIADAQVAPDVHRLRDFLYTSFGELCRSAKVKTTQRGASPTARKRSSKRAEAVGAADREPAKEEPPASTRAPGLTSPEGSA